MTSYLDSLTHHCLHITRSSIKFYRQNLYKVKLNSRKIRREISEREDHEYLDPFKDRKRIVQYKLDNWA